MKELALKAEQILGVKFIEDERIPEGVYPFMLDVGTQVKGPLFKLEEEVRDIKVERLYVAFVKGFLAISIGYSESEELETVFKGPISRISKLKRVLNELGVVIIRNE